MNIKNQIDSSDSQPRSGDSLILGIWYLLRASFVPNTISMTPHEHLDSLSLRISSLVSFRKILLFNSFELCVKNSFQFISTTAQFHVLQIPVPTLSTLGFCSECIVRKAPLNQPLLHNAAFLRLHFLRHCDNFGKRKPT